MDGNDGNPFDTDHQADTYDNNGSYGDSAYNAAPPPQPVAVQPPKPPQQPQQQFGNPNDQIQTFEVSDNSNPTELQRTCSGYSLGPISYWCMFSGLMLAFAGIFDMTRKPKFLDFIVDVYLGIVGIGIITIEAPSCFCNQGCQQKAFMWIRMYRRNWGKATIFFFFAVLSCAGDWVKTFFGVLVMLVCFMLWYMGAQTAWVTKKIVLKVLSGYEHGNDDGIIASERMFKKYAKDNMLDKEGVVKIAAEMGFGLNSSESETIALFFDEDFDGKINLDEWSDGIRRIMEGTRFM